MSNSTQSNKKKSYRIMAQIRGKITLPSIRHPHIVVLYWVGFLVPFFLFVSSFFCCCYYCLCNLHNPYNTLCLFTVNPTQCVRAQRFRMYSCSRKMVHCLIYIIWLHTHSTHFMLNTLLILHIQSVAWKFREKVC